MNYYIADGVRYELKADQIYLNLSRQSLKTLVVVSDTLKELYCTSNQLSLLDVSNCATLKELYCHDNQLTSLDVSSCVNLKWLSCHDNQLTSLDVSSCVALKTLSCDNNQLSLLDVSNCATLETLSCDNNQLSLLDVSNCATLETLYCHNNQLSLLDVSGCDDLYWFYSDIEATYGDKTAISIDGLFTAVNTRYRDGKYEILEGLVGGENTFVAIRGKYSAHGITIEKAKADCRFKWMVDNKDVDKLVSDIKNRDAMSVLEFRLLTGSCEQGCLSFLSQHGMEGVTELPLKQAIDLVQGSYGSERINELFN